MDMERVADSVGGRIVRICAGAAESWGLGGPARPAGLAASFLFAAAMCCVNNDPSQSQSQSQSGRRAPSIAVKLIQLNAQILPRMRAIYEYD